MQNQNGDDHDHVDLVDLVDLVDYVDLDDLDDLDDIDVSKQKITCSLSSMFLAMRALYLF